MSLNTARGCQGETKLNCKAVDYWPITITMLRAATKLQQKNERKVGMYFHKTVISGAFKLFA